MADKTGFLRRYGLRWFSRKQWQMRLVFWGGALAVGAVSVIFAMAANHAQDLFTHMTTNPWWALAITPFGFVLAAYLAKTVFNGSQGSGIPQAIAARQFRDSKTREKLLSLRITIGKIFLTLFGLACGASIGREGPTVQVGATIMLYSARIGGMGMERGLILAGSAAGVAAAFNTPLAGIVFAIEEMSRAFEQRTSGLVLIAVILAGLASLGIVGNYNYFGSTNAVLVTTTGWVAVFICGIAGGLLGALFCKLVLHGTDWSRAWFKVTPIRRAMLWAGVCGLIVAVCGLLSAGETYDTGYTAARHAVEGHYVYWTFPFLKFIANVASTLSGIPGGLFAPSLSVGAGIGSIVGQLLGLHSVGAIVVLGMAAYFSGVTQAPITAFVIIEEMTNANEMVIPLMIASFIGFGISQMFQRESLYHALSHRFIDDLRAEAAARETASTS